MEESVIGIRVDATSYDQSVAQLFDWVNNGDCRLVFAANVHMLMEARDSRAFRAIVNAADLVTPDGMPLVWVLRLKGYRHQERVYGPTLMLHVLKRAAREGVDVGFLGGAPEVLKALEERLKVRFPGLSVVYSLSPPYRDPTPEEDDLICEEIRKSRVRVLFVGLGCPRQERWMADHRERINAVMLGVGAAFDFHAGVKPQAPVWMQSIGLEWLFRLITEPGRLWKRYLYHNPRFIFLAIADLLGLFRYNERRR